MSKKTPEQFLLDYEINPDLMIRLPSNNPAIGRMVPLTELLRRYANQLITNNQQSDD